MIELKVLALFIALVSLFTDLVRFRASVSEVTVLMQSYGPATTTTETVP